MINKILYILLAFFIFSCGDEKNPSKKEKRSPKKSVEKYRDHSQNFMKKTRVDAISQIEKFSDSLYSMTMKLNEQTNGLDKNARIALKSKIIVVRQQCINENLSFVKSFPKDSMAPYCLLNVKTIYDEVSAYEKSINSMDSILINYPDFRYYSLILEDKAATLDHCMKVRDTSIIREAYEKILSHPQTTESRFKEISERLLNLDKKINEMPR